MITQTRSMGSIAKLLSVEYGYFFAYKKAWFSPPGDEDRNRPNRDSGGALRMKASFGFSPISSHKEPYILPCIIQ